MYKKLVSVVCFLTAIAGYSLLTACNSGREKEKQSDNGDSIKERLITINKVMVDNEASRIAEFIRRHDWKMDSTRTGVHYWIVRQGSGEMPKGNAKVRISYKLFLLDGTLVNESEKDKPLEFVLGMGENT